LPQERRRLIQWLLGGGFTASLASFLYPAVRFMFPPQVPDAAVNEAAVGKVGDLKPSSGKIVRFGSRPALLVRVSDSEWRAFSAICTHLNCTVQFNETNHQIWCACHNGFYDLNGRPVAGPPPKPLEEFAVRVRGDEVVIARRA
jgi:cytochrome b6-f complex iron-sulfur subunit